MSIIITIGTSEKIVNKSYDEYLKQLNEVTLAIFRKMLNDIGSKQIIIPLSGGYDLD